MKTCSPDLLTELQAEWRTDSAWKVSIETYTYFNRNENHFEVLLTSYPFVESQKCWEGEHWNIHLPHMTPGKEVMPTLGLWAEGTLLHSEVILDFSIYAVHVLKSGVGAT